MQSSVTLTGKEVIIIIVDFIFPLFYLHSQNRALCERLAAAIVASLERAEDEIRAEFEKTETFREAVKIMTRLGKTVKKRKNEKKDEYVS